ncbi:transmembrane protein 154 isoform X1 [Phycodurus eques]|uniref:transmembrane protein 154 isoform X1 n=1 Tax=Phycodurus eques TaxID=693459 RepID=UPI002ACDBDFB|nr:transmembrane protein 154 isoform X1 [Phycodurus eques]XP_061534656.1 transmembrane protein 154 isoform X1 [Phycodurus eques]
MKLPAVTIRLSGSCDAVTHNTTQQDGNMSAPRPSCSSMRGHHGNTPLFLLLLWLLTGTWTGKVSSQDEGTEEESRTVEEVTVDQEQAEEDKKTSEPTLSPPDAPTTLEPSTTQEANSDSEVATEDKTEDLGSRLYSPGSTDKPGWLNSTLTPQRAEGLSITVILIPVALVVFIIVIIMFALFLKRRFNIEAAVQDSRKDDPYLDGSSTEKVPMPMFEEDVPSVLELEMEELDQWMIKDG